MNGGGKSLNPWPAFSDMAFMLAINCLVVAGAVAIVAHHQQQEVEKKRQQVEQADKENEKYRERLRQLGIDPNEVNECGLATPVVQAMEGCLRAKEVSVERRGCSLSVETAIRFAPGSCSLADDSLRQARLVAECVIVGAEAVDRAAEGDAVGAVGLDAISIEGHADACGYRDWATLKTAGLETTTCRAKAVYDLVYDLVRSKAMDLAESARLRVLSRVATRSFGPYRPLRSSACDCSRRETCDANRRVEIVVQGSLGADTANWKPVAALQFVEARSPNPGRGGESSGAPSRPPNADAQHEWRMPTFGGFQ